jgi:hypothetical protein
MARHRGRAHRTDWDRATAAHVVEEPVAAVVVRSWSDAPKAGNGNPREQGLRLIGAPRFELGDR